MKTFKSIRLMLAVYFCFISTLYSQTTEMVYREENISNVSDGVTVSLRCPYEGVIISRNYLVSREGVVVEADTGVDCSGGDCPAWEMSFVSAEDPSPFNVNMEIECEVTTEE